MRDGGSEARRLLVLTAIGYGILAAALVLPPWSVVWLAPFTWLPAALPLVFGRRPRQFRIIAAGAGAWLLLVSAGAAIAGGLVLLPGGLLMLAAAWMSPERRWSRRRYWSIAAAPGVAVVLLIGVAYVIDRLGPPSEFEVRLVPGATEQQSDEFVDAFLHDPAVAGIGTEGPFDWRSPIRVDPARPVEESRDLEKRLRDHPLVRSVRDCRC